LAVGIGGADDRRREYHCLAIENSIAENGDVAREKKGKSQAIEKKD
jgi:hypothetical protein